MGTIITADRPDAMQGTGPSPVSKFLYGAVAIVVLSLGQVSGLVPSSWGQAPQSLIVPDRPTGRVSSVTAEEIDIDGKKHHLSPEVLVKWDMGGSASLQDIRPGDRVQFTVKNLQIVLLLIVQPG